MGQVKAVFDGGVATEPEEFTAGASHGLKFRVAVDDVDKNRDTGKYEKNGDTTWIGVTLWNDAADSADVRKNDIVEVTAVIKERSYEGKNGPGKSLETKFVDSVVTKWRREGEPAYAGATATGFGDDGELPTGFM